MNSNCGVRDVQLKILDIMKYVDSLCRKNGIVYFIMGGTALGAVRHGGFIPWDDDLDIFMTPEEYSKFKTVFEKENSDQFVLQEWRTVESYLEYAKVRMNGTTIIEECYKDRKDLHQGIYVDIMILHKVPEKRLVQKKIYYCSKFVTLLGLSQRNWKPKTKGQFLALKLLKLLPKKALGNFAYKNIYKYDDLTNNYKWCYWITPAKFQNGLFDERFFSEPVDTVFEDTLLLGSRYIKDYLVYRYGDYMSLPSEEKRGAAVHAMLFDTMNDYSRYIGERDEDEKNL